MISDVRSHPLAAPTFLAWSCLAQARGVLLDSMEPKRLLMVDIRNADVRMKSMYEQWQCLACCCGKDEVTPVK